MLEAVSDFSHHQGVKNSVGIRKSCIDILENPEISESDIYALIRSPRLIDGTVDGHKKELYSQAIIVFRRRF